MYCARKIDKWLDEWKNKDNKCPILLTGIRQCGKTESVKNFAKKYQYFININFWDRPEYRSIFEKSLEVDDIVSNISLMFPSIPIKSKKTLIFFDEIQECPKARLSFKNFAIDGRYDVIGSGSYLGINGYITGDSTPAPVGYDDVYMMKTMDFEEFLWANGYSQDQINELEGHFLRREPLPPLAHEIYRDLFLSYACVGGFPKSVKTYIENNKNLLEAYKATRSTIFDIKTDFGRRKGKDGQPIFDASEVARIREVFDLIPTFLSKKNKRFVVSKIETGSAQNKLDAIEYLKQSHIVDKVYNLSTPSLPLSSSVNRKQFKLFPEDISIATSLFGLGTLKAMNNRELGTNKGAIYESLVYEGLSKAGFPVYYFSKESGLEIDFVICYLSKCYLVEAKARNGNTKASKTVMAHPEHYGPTKLLKVGDYQIGEEGDILTIPHYMLFLLGRDNETI